MISLEYPPTHTYDTNSFEPTNILKKRIEKINSIAPEFFKGEKLLDLACNKGGISFYYAKNFKRVIGIDKFKEFIDFCNSNNKFNNVKFIQSSFRDLILDERFDRIFIGNAHHYFFNDSGGHNWIHKLAVLSCGKVLIEGPVGMECSDMSRCIPAELQDEFTFDKFMGMMNKYFVLKAKIPTVSATPDRYIMLFERKKDSFDNKYQLKDLKILKKILVRDIGSNILLTDKGLAKIITNGKFRETSINIARLSPISNGLIGTIYKGSKFIGWLEKYNKFRPYRSFENEIPLFVLHCKNQVFLARVGYIDLDNSGINHFTNNNKLFDKGDIYPIKWMGERNYKYPDGTYFRVLNQSYRKIPKDIQIKISKALSTKDSKIIEQTYKEIIKKWDTT